MSTSEINGLSEQGFVPTKGPVIGDIEFKNVRFSYPSRSGVPILENVSFRVKPGQTVALVGASGSRKSTCVQLLQRFYDVFEGEITFDGIGIHRLNVKWLRSQLGVVGQEPVLFNMTIAENISFGLECVSREEIVAAAKQAYAHNFIMQLPKDYDTIVGERGSSLSGGQKQRIAIAKALARNPSTLLLDEATSALDFQSESVVQAALERASHGRSTIIIAHRLSTIKAADMIYVLDKGIIVEQGTHTELMRQQGRYHQLVLSQEAFEIMRDDSCEEEFQEEELNGKLAEDYVEVNSRTRKINSSNCLLHQDTVDEGVMVPGIEDVSASGCFWRLWKTNLHEWHYFLAVIVCSIVRGIQFPVYAYIFGEFVQTFTIKDDVEIISRGSIRGATGSRFAGVLQAFTIVIGTALMSFYYIPKLTAVTIIFVPIVMYTSFLEGKVMGSNNVIERDSIEASCSLAVEALNNIRTVASLCAEKQCMRLYEDALAEAHRVNLKRAHIRGVVYGVVTGGPIFCYCLCIWYGGYLVEQQCANIGDVFKVAEGLIVSAMFGAAAISFAPDYDKAKLAARRIFDLIDSTPLISRFSNHCTKSSESEAVEAQVEFETVNFVYKNRPSVNVLRDLTLNVKPGDSVAICGPSGSGKTTCAALIFRFYDPVTGHVKFSGTDLKHLNLDHLRKKIGLVSQEPILFDCSIKENIAYGDNERSLNERMNEIINSAIAANIHNFIMSLPAGYETRVGLLGSQLSGGQKQRIAIARAILRHPKLLVLDEATSALDSESEIAVHAALDIAKKGRTSITIAHRLSSIINADKIFVMKGGSIVEYGTHTELIDRHGIYQAMWKAQSSLQTG
ncbi:unnamed protein product [Orchesella dallaii]|uniref:Multidrug resistance protein 1 n=1 Tax=Orchesella dallaii TaxID=48710 RepID=A0ABP1PLQ6_9HEXA